MDYIVTFDVNDGKDEQRPRPERQLAEAEVHFVDPDGGPFAGLKLVGFGVWRSPGGGTYVTVPGRAFGAGQERRYFDYVRAVSGVHREVDRLKEFIHEAWRRQRDGQKEA